MPARPLSVPLLLTLAGLLSPFAAQALPDASPEPAPSAARAEPAVQRTVIDDAETRVEELRVRGEVRRITVTPKHGGKAYEIIPANGARDLAPGPGSSKGAAGQRVWNVLDF